jgi:hypothetical protein
LILTGIVEPPMAAASKSSLTLISQTAPAFVAGSVNCRGALAGKFKSREFPARRHFVCARFLSFADLKTPINKYSWLFYCQDTPKWI